MNVVKEVNTNAMNMVHAIILMVHTRVHVILDIQGMVKIVQVLLIRYRFINIVTCASLCI